ncbi:MAG: Mini-ribonuclease 3 [Geitlerinemataceae cyanobacterium]
MNAPLLSASLSNREARQISPGILAYVGDAVYELYVRRCFLEPPRRPNDHHRCVVEQVRAERQAQHLDAIEARLSEAELDVVRRGRNATGRVPRRADRQTYQRATSLEALVGYLYLCDTSRLDEVLSWLDLSIAD